MPRGLSEFELIDSLRSRAGVSARLLEGIGDDAAVTAPDGFTVTSVDAVVDGIHFHRKWSGPESIAVKAVATALSDIAAMGARPGEVYVALGLPPDADRTWVERLAASIVSVTEGAGAVLAGGDTVASQTLFLAVTVVGHVERTEDLVLRSGALPGHLVAVTGSLGGAAAGHRLLEHPERREPIGEEVRQALIARQLEPRARLTESRILAASGTSSMIDVSDGLAADLGHIATASGVRLNIRAELLPVATGAAEVAAAASGTGEDMALAGGEDYELALTIDPTTFEAARTELRAAGCELTSIGSVAEGEGVVITRGGKPIDPPAGHDHLS